MFTFTRIRGEPNRENRNARKESIKGIRILTKIVKTIYGSVYKCQTCPSVKFCKKCHSKIELYHMVDDGRLHVFGISDTEAEEFVVPKSPSLKASSRPQEPTDGTDAKTQRERVDTGVLEVGDDNAEDDVTEVVDFSDLKDLGSFTDSD